MFGLKDIYWVIINSFVSFIYLFIISKLLGKKQIAQLEFIDYVVGISLGSIAADMSIETEAPFYHALIAMTIFFFLAFLVALVGRKNTFFKRMLKGKPSMLIYEGKIDYKELVKCKIDVNDLLSMLREKDYFDITKVEYAIFEPSGNLSVLPRGEERPVVIGDISPKSAQKSRLLNVLISDGRISKSGLNQINKSKEWLFKKVGAKDKKQLKNILLATCDEKNKVKVYTKNKVELRMKNKNSEL